MNAKESEPHIDRIDRFFVPMAAEEEFLAAVAETNTAFDNLEGGLQRYVLRGKKTEDGSHYMTFVEWESMAAYERTLAVAQAKHKQMNITPQSLFHRLEIDAELGVFTSVTDNSH